MVLPGQTKIAPLHEDCCVCDIPATKGIVGEVDSFGYEIDWYCEEHYKERKKELSEETNAGHCDWCGKFADELKYRRDSDEGTSGPVYEVCQHCIDKDLERNH